ncbi:MAG: thiamine phosphate synthase [Halothiobacillaceae bacterium]|nr:thiamine phosphate synthase [Halothiobacillaceae bacterium]HER34581.1 NUDIX domain-containing protein [Halothiobacillaceae bacterium]
MSRPRTDIVLGLLREFDGRVWTEVRPEGKHLAGTRAFPGGKRRSGETLRVALERELAEETGIRVRRARRLITLDWDYPDRHLRLIGFEVTDWEGHPHPVEGQTLVAEPLDRATRGDWLAAMPPANRGMVNALLLPRCLAITPPIGVAGTGAWQVEVESRLNALPAPMLVNLRPGPALEAGEVSWPRLARVAQAAGHWPVVNPPGERPWPEGLDPRVGLHLNHARLMSISAQKVRGAQLCGHLVTAAVHDRATLDRANELGADLVTVSPLRATATHPDVPGIGWAAFADLAESASMPVYALGGVSRADLPRIWRRGGFGVAGISAFW